MQKCSRILIAVLFFGLYSNLSAAAKTDDIRILIDVSESMKINDPSDFRISALKMFNGLVPEGSKAGVWTIDRYVDMAVNWGTVNDAWRQAADVGASAIHSDGIYTNIESGLSRASLGWEEADADTRRSIILVTDGSVSISNDAVTNQVSRQNIITKNLQALKQSGVVIHTVALSNNADESLLKKLALETGGSFQKAEIAQNLHRIFFKTFERVTQPDTVKLTENLFSIDKKIRAITLLIFRQKHSAPTLLYPPGSSPMSSKKPGNSVWRSDAGYDLVTIKNPITGVWTIDADTDQDNRLMVQSDLKLNVTGFIPYMMPGQPVQISVELHDLDNKIIENSLLQFVDFNIAHTGIDGLEQVSKLESSSAESDKGQYSYYVENGLEEGTHGFVISADSQIFNRSRRYNIEVQWPVVVRVDPGRDPGNYQLSIRPREAYLDQARLRPSVVLQAPDGNRQDLALIQVDNDWRADIETDQDGVYQAFIKIDSSPADNEPVSYDLGGFPMIGMIRQPIPQETEIEPTIATEPVLGTVVESDSKSETILKVETAVAPGIAKVDKQPDWTRISIELAVINLVFIILAAGVWLFLRDEKDETGLRLVQVVENV
jgi:uncharacterized protein (TIGR03503 family)